MSTTKIKHSPSINIIRDKDYSFEYVQTPNSSLVFNNLLQSTLKGSKSHLLIGAYGTGKSSFLLAAKQTLTHKENHFKGYETLIRKVPVYEFISIVGSYSSLMDYIASIFLP